MAAQAQAPQHKVLRIGIVQDGKIVQERLIKAGEPVTVGESTKNTFVLPPGDLPKRFSLFVPKGKGKSKGNGYVLQFSDGMRGKISYRNAIITLKQLREQGKASRKGQHFVLPLSEGYRGKVGIGNATVLFQFVPPPPEIATGAKMDFRPRLIEDDDPVFLGFLALFTALACVLLVFVYTHEPIESRGFQEIPDRFTKVVMEPPDEVEVPEIVEDENAEGEEVVKTEAEAEPTEAAEEEAAEEATPEEAEVAEAERQEQLEEEVLAESQLLMALIGTRGETNNGSRVEDLFGEGDNFSQDLDAALANVSGVEVASTANLELKGGTGVGTENADIGDLAKAKGGGSNVGEGPATTVEGKVGTGAVSMIDGEGDGDGIQKVVRKYIGQVKYCYEGRLKENPSLSGRVEVQIVVSRGRVQSVDLIGNTTGDPALGTCISGKIRGWRFPAETDADFIYPFALSQ